MSDKAACPECGSEGRVDYRVPVLSVYPEVYTFVCDACGHSWSQSFGDLEAFEKVIQRVARGVVSPATKGAGE